MLAEAVLGQAGYEVLSAGTTLESKAVIESEQHLDLLFIDITLVDETEAGLAIAQEAAKRRPGLPVLYTTGRGITDGMIRRFVAPHGFIAKPYRSDAMVRIVADLLRSDQRP